MDYGSVDRIRNASFSHAVRGYDRHEVDRFIAELADWLEESGDDETVAAAVRAELERIGEQTSNILTEAHDAAQAIRADAEQEVRQTLIDANLKSETLRTNADEYAEQVRDEAEAYARKTRGDADAHARGVHEEAASALQKARADGEKAAKHIAEDASRRKREMEAVISDLEERRDAVLSELERLASGLAGTATQHRSRPADGEQPSDGEPTREARPRPVQPK